MEEKGYKKFSPVFYGLKSIKEPSSFLTFIVIFLTLFAIIFLFIIEILGLGAFLGKVIYPASSYVVLEGEFAFISAILIIIFSVCTLFYYKAYYIVPTDLNILDLIRQSLKKFPKFFISIFVQFSVSILGLVAFVVPGLYYGSSVMFFGFFCVYGNSDIRSAFLKSKDLAKNVRLDSIMSLFIYLVILLVFIYVVRTLDIAIIYKGLIASMLLSYWIVSYNNMIFNLADRTYKSTYNRKEYNSRLMNNYNKDNSY